MKTKTAPAWICIILFSLLGHLDTPADEAEAFFGTETVHEIRITFEDPNWYPILLESHANDPEDPYFPARFEYGDLVLDPVGVRFKGNSSFGINTQKKSFKIDFNRYDEGEEETTFFGMKKLNLNNGFHDPSLMREVLFLEFAGRTTPAIRAAHSRVVVNGSYWGLYVAVEQIDKTFIQSRFGSEEDGNLFEGEATGEEPQSAFGSDLTYLGPDPEDYAGHYELKTNEDENDWSRFIQFVDVLNNTPTVEFPTAIEPLFDVDAWLEDLSLNILYVNLDSYCGSAHNYYLYDRDDTGRFTHILWDLNETFGSFQMGIAPYEDPLELDPFWMPQMPPQQPAAERPLMERLWEVDAYSRDYLRKLARMLREGFDEASFQARIEVLADRIREDVAADPNYPYSMQDFETNLTDDVQAGNRPIYGLTHFVRVRAAFLDARLDELAEPRDLRLNEVQTVNTATLQDGQGEFEPWVEITNLGPGRLSLSGLHLSDDAGDPTKWTLPDLELDDGLFRILFLDGEAGEGADHAPFRLENGTGELILSDGTGAILDRVSFPEIGSDEAWGRAVDGVGDWQEVNPPTPGAANVPWWPGQAVRLNEFMADNDTALPDPDGNGGYPDWIELYNPGPDTVDLGGFTMTDDLTRPEQVVLPDGLTLEGGEFLVLWADNDSDQGPNHLDFKLSAGGEEIGLFAPDGTPVDSVTFGAQEPDVSMGRVPDGTGAWQVLDTFSPGTPNDDGPVCTLECSAQADPASGEVPLEAVFAAEVAAEGCISDPSCFWEFGDGETSDAAAPTHIYGTEGTYGWSLTVTADGVTCTAGGTIQVYGEEGPSGDCDGDGSISIGEVQRAVNMFLGFETPGCGVDADGSGAVSVGEVQAVINAYLGG